MARTAADQFAEILAAIGIKRICGIVGDSLNGLTDSLRRQGKIVGAIHDPNSRGYLGRCA
jgi:pyruvate dehydrogenase (quinone)